jgi:predicted nucleic acid-binding protein
LIQVDAPMILGAITTMRRFRLSFWDALIIQAALSSGSTVLYTEDLAHGMSMETLVIRNPFLE